MMFIHVISPLSETHTLHLFSDTCGSQEVYMGDNGTVPSFVIEDTKSCFEMIREILTCVTSLEQEHKSYQRLMEKEAVLGSQ